MPPLPAPDQVFLHLQHIGMNGVFSLGGNLAEFAVAQVPFARNHPDRHRKNDVFAGYPQGAGRFITRGEVVTTKTAPTATDIGHRVGVPGQGKDNRAQRVWLDPKSGPIVVGLIKNLQVDLLFLFPEQIPLSD